MNTRTATAERAELELEPAAKLPAKANGQAPTTADAQGGPGMLGIIERASRDPNVDVDKFERLMAMRERLEAREARAAYFAAMATMKPDLPVIERNGRIVIADKVDKAKIIQSTPYARWEDIDEAIAPVLTKHGFSLTFKPGVSADNRITVTGILTHNGGHYEEGMITLPHDSSGSKNSVQAVGSSLSYGKRYAATMLLNIRTKGEDDDGEKSDELQEISTEEMDELQGLLDRSHSPEPKFFKYMGVERLSQIRVGDMQKARSALNIALDVYQRTNNKAPK